MSSHPDDATARFRESMDALASKLTRADLSQELAELQALRESDETLEELAARLDTWEAAAEERRAWLDADRAQARRLIDAGEWEWPADSALLNETLAKALAERKAEMVKGITSLRGLPEGLQSPVIDYDTLDHPDDD